MRIIFITILQLAPFILVAQGGYKTGDVVHDIPVKTMLNYSGPVTSLQNFKSKITVIDFFGTWCAPCIKALPMLASLQARYKNDISIVLVSNEEESKLRTFIEKRKSFALPVIVDSENAFERLFQPPSYPYTVVINKDGKVLVASQGLELTGTRIENWLSGNKDSAENMNGPVLEPNNDQSKRDSNLPMITRSDNLLVQLSQDFVYAEKTGEDAGSFKNKLRLLDFEELETAFKDDSEKMAFWINLYNGFTQSLLKQNPELYEKRSRFFKARQIEIAGKQFSLDDLEHGILRRSKIKWSLGYLNKLFPGKTEKSLRVDKLDYRIHFALNCGAKSCPPIAFYDPGTIELQLDMAMRSYLSSEAEYDPLSNIVKLPAIMSWFRRDFGGKKNMVALLKKNGLISALANPIVKFKKYDWTLYLNNY